MPIESSQYFIILFRVNQVFTFYHFINVHTPDTNTRCPKVMKIRPVFWKIYPFEFFRGQFSTFQKKTFSYKRIFHFDWNLLCQSFFRTNCNLLENRVLMYCWIQKMSSWQTFSKYTILFYKLSSKGPNRAISRQNYIIKPQSTKTYAKINFCCRLLHS